MSFSHEVRHAGRLVVVTGSPDGSTEEAAAAMLEAGKDPAVVRPAAYVVDVRRTREVPTPSQTRDIARFHARREAPWTSVTAMVVREGLQYGMARMIETLTGLDGAQAMVTTDPDEAVAWALQALEDVKQGVPLAEG